MDFALWSDVGLLPFFVLTFVLGGATAMATGRAVAETWRPLSQVVAYAAVLAWAVRFLHYALFDGYFISLENFVDGLWRWAATYAILAAIGVLGYRMRRAGQMETQYGWVAGSGA